MKDQDTYRFIALIDKMGEKKKKLGQPTDFSPNPLGLHTHNTAH